MIFHILEKDRKDSQIYSGGAICQPSLINEEASTALFGKTLESLPFRVKCLEIYSGGKTIEELCPDHLRFQFNKASSKFLAHKKSLQNAKVGDDFGIHELLPEKVLSEYAQICEKIVAYQMPKLAEPKNYNLLYDVRRLCSQISSQELKINVSNYSGFLTDDRFKVLAGKLSRKEVKTSINYNIFGTKTGRLTTFPGSFPILTVAAEYRDILVPQRDYFVELDFNSAELRVLLGLCGHYQPQEDLHDWNMKNVFASCKERADAKKRTFAWLYNDEAEDQNLEKFYNRKFVKENYYSDGKIENIFGREIECEERLATNYIMQSTANDTFLNSVLAIQKIIDENSLKSRIVYVMHDSVLLDFSRDDQSHLKEIVRQFSFTPFGNFPINVRAGTKYSEMGSKLWTT